MKVNGVPYRSIWFDEAKQAACIFDQTLLPHGFEVLEITTLEQACHAIAAMQVRGAPLIGAVAAYGLALALAHDPSPHYESHAADALIATRPTASKLQWAVNRVRRAIAEVPENERAAAAKQEAARICDEDVATCSAIGDHGLAILKQRWQQKTGDGPLNILTHCNAGWLATVDWGTALAPIYKAHDLGIPVHVWVDETRPRNQGAQLTAWELGQHGVPHTLIVDNAGGHLMQHGEVDLCIVGTDRTTANGDVCNKIGTYLKALAAKDNDIPFYVALPSSTVDWSIADGVREIPIEQRSANEVTEVSGMAASGEVGTVRITPPSTPAGNYAFDVTPARLVTGLITECGVYEASEAGMRALHQALEQ